MAHNVRISWQHISTPINNYKLEISQYVSGVLSVQDFFFTSFNDAKNYADLQTTGTTKIYGRISSDMGELIYSSDGGSGSYA